MTKATLDRIHTLREFLSSPNHNQREHTRALLELAQLQDADGPAVHELTYAEIPEKFQPQNFYPTFGTPRWDTLRAELAEWLDATATFYYSRPAESFFEYEALELAAAAGCVAVIMENLS